MTTRALRTASLAALAGLLLAGQVGCTFVKPHERGRLAHPSMASGRLVGPGEAHVRAVQEGAIGGDIGAEASCGCN